MEIRYDIENSVIQVDGVDLYAHTLDKNFIGVCSNCNSDVNSLSYHSYESGMIVAARCSLCDTIFAIMYDENWKWKGEETISKFFNLKSSNDLRNLEGIDRKKLSTIFTPAETTSMYAKARGEKYIRQYLYRARKKYNDFEELFGIQINI
ncbi:hypothetical protein [Methanolobus sp.]|jgi:hypothetical protein|uniref:hypothetical protein n=1 Tax=Methanolobus sp. TaxID=1874737 RepID=UPI0025DC6DD2|nr:hypothetical protein [Methanolobus sp.]